MAIQASRRRFLALTSLFFAAGPVGPLRAQSLPQKPPQPSSNAIPVGPWGKAPGDGTHRPVTKDVGGWKIISQMRQSRAFLLEDNETKSGGIKRGEFFYGGRGELRLEYWNGTGKGAGYRGWLKVQSAGPGVPNFAARVFVDGEERDASKLAGSTGQDLKEWFGQDLAGLRDVETIRVTMTIYDQEHAVYEARPAGTAEAMKAMREVPDYNYRVFDIGKQKASGGSSDPGGSTGSNRKDCYLTTACCDLVGLPDDCFELTALRGFRDGVMAGTERGRRDIVLYYVLAPQIVAEIRRRGEERRLLRLYFSHILPSAVLARLGFRSLPARLYTGLMRRLVARYLPERLALVT